MLNWLIQRSQKKDCKESVQKVMNWDAKLLAFNGYTAWVWLPQHSRVSYFEQKISKSNSFPFFRWDLKTKRKKGSFVQENKGYTGW